MEANPKEIYKLLSQNVCIFKKTCSGRQVCTGNKRLFPVQTCFMYQLSLSGENKLYIKLDV